MKIYDSGKTLRLEISDDVIGLMVFLCFVALLLLGLGVYKQSQNYGQIETSNSSSESVKPLEAVIVTNE